jgi:adenine-specific DNA glycosylase
MLNQTHFRQVRRIIWSFFDRWPTPQALASADQSQVAEHVKSLGFGNRRSASLVRMAQQIASDPGWMARPQDLHGVGRYAMDSWKMFIERRPMDVQPTDKELLRYQRWYSEEFPCQSRPSS